MKITYDVLEDLLIQIGDQSDKDDDQVNEWVAKAIPTTVSIEGRDWVEFKNPFELVSVLFTAILKLQNA